MSNKLIKNKFRAKCFEAYGLNNFRNFLSAPECDCGCGGKGSLILEDTKELFGFMHIMLAEHDCNQCAIFAHAHNDEMFAIVKLDDVSEYDDCDEIDSEEYPIKFFGIKETDMDFFKEFDAEFGLHCYGLLIQNNNGSWDIIED